MKQIKKWLEKNEMSHFDFEDDYGVFVVLPIGVIFRVKDNGKYYISFNITEDKSSCFDFYVNIQTEFEGKIGFSIDCDCFISVDRELDQLEYVSFGDTATEHYYGFIREYVKTDLEIPKNVVFH